MLTRLQRIQLAVRGAAALLRRSDFTAAFCQYYALHSGWLKTFRDRFQGEDCFLIGNGPSLNKVDLASLNRFHLIGLNKIYLIFDKQPLNLTLHVAINPLVIQQSAHEFAKLPCPSFLSYQYAREVVPARGNIHYILTSTRLLPSFAHAWDQPVWEGYTVTYVALQLAFFMGFENVFLVGVDHSFAAAGKPNEKQTMAEPDQNHFDPRYFRNQEWHLPDLEGSEIAYQMAKFAFERNGRRIVDATIGGKCTIFPKMNIDDAFRICRPRRTS
jgi:hypothetical protein